MGDFAAIKGLDEARRKLRSLAQRVANASPLMNALAFGLKTMWQQNILAGPNDRWQAGPSLRVQATGGTTLRDRGNLIGSINGVATSATSCEIGSALTVRGATRDWNLLAIHELGAVVKPVNAKALRFKLPFAPSYRIVSLKTGKRLKTGVAEGDNWIIKRSVRIPARPTSPFDFKSNTLLPAGDAFVRRAVGPYVISGTLFTGGSKA